MELKTLNEIDIISAPHSKINEIDFENLNFGNVFTDHMFVCDYVNGREKGRTKGINIDM